MTDKGLMEQALDAFNKMIGRKPEFVEQVITALRDRLEQPEQLKAEEHSVLRQAIWDSAELVAPPQRKPLDEIAVFDLADQHMYGGGKNYGILEFARAIEAAHGIKP